jgi:uncharacterized protein with von Willebrand factor type A (vWA) domain
MPVYTLAPPPTPRQAAASEPLRRFLQVARSAGLRVSAAEGIDAARAVDLIGYGDRTMLKDTLGLILAKTPDEKLVYDQTFDLYFKRDDFLRREEPEPQQQQQEQQQGNPQSNAPTGSGGPSEQHNEQEGGLGPTLSELLEKNDTAALATAMEAAARAAKVQEIRYFTQKNRYVRQILERMGLREVEREIMQLRDAQTAGGAERAQMLDQRLERLWDSTRDFVERALLLYARGEQEQFRERMLREARLMNLDPRDLARMRVLVRQIAKRLATRYSRKRRRKQRGQLDVRRTMRKNMGWGGIPFVTAWKTRQVDKPRVMVLCDVSESVAWVSEFLLMFIYALNEVLSDIRAYAYTGFLVEVSDILEHNTIDEAVKRIMDTAGFGSSNYGSAFADFEDGWMDAVTSKTTIIILGDARGNGNDPRTDILGRMAQRAKRIVWLNPEFRSSWGTGDSDMYRYIPYCNFARVCASLNDLERVITDLLEVDA